MRENPYITKQESANASLWKDKAPLLGKLDMELTERCNNNCMHCCINLPADDFEAKKKELSTEEIKNILKEAVFLGAMTVRFTGGEPLLREDFRDLYVFARRIGLKVMLFTNATLITSSLAELLERMPPLEKIEVTVYGMKKNSYEAMTRIPGSFEASQRGISLLLEKKIPFVVKGALSRNNMDEIEEFKKWALTIPWMKGRAPVHAMFFDLHGRRDFIKNKLIRGLRISPEEGLKIFAPKNNEYIREMKEFCSKFIKPCGDKLFSCGSGLGGGCVDAYGYFQPCLMLRHPETVYDLKKGTLKDALTNFFPRLREKKATNPEYLKYCANCFLKGLCEQCPAKSWAEHGTLDTPVKYFCQIAHTQARYLGLLGETEMGWQVNDWKERIRQFVS